MSMPEFFKLHILNNTGSTIEFSSDGGNNTCVIKAQGWKITDGAIEYSDEIDLFLDPTANLTDGSSLEGAEYNNSTNKYLGFFCRVEFTSDNTPDGSLDIFVEHSTSGAASGSYPSDEPDFVAEEHLEWVKSIPLDGSNASPDVGVNFALGASPR